MREWLTRTLTEPLTILEAPREDDEYGRDIPNWDEAEAIESVGRFQPSGEDETLVGRDEQRGDMKLFLPPDVTITGRDRVIAESTGFVYQVMGPPRRLREPWNETEHHLEVSLRRIDGL
jgi:hypothetical protein